MSTEHYPEGFSGHDHLTFECEECKGIFHDSQASTNEARDLCWDCHEAEFEEEAAYWSNYFGVTKGKGPASAMKPYEPGDSERDYAISREAHKR